MDLSFVFPCLNEASTLRECIEKVRATLNELTGLTYEIIVADNGSSDASKKVAADCGVRVIDIEEKGYGSALTAGINAADGTHVVFADADGTYIYEHTAELYRRAIDCDSDLVVASRLKNVEGGAMPFLHQRVGTPVLSALINLLFGGRITDCNSGFRCVRKSAFERWNISSSGMEFASELLVKALKSGANVMEIESGLRRAPANRKGHLRTWRDGMRHLLFLLSQRPDLFELIGFALVALSSVIQILAFVIGPIEIGGANVFDIHTKLMLMVAGLSGAQLYVFGIVMVSTRPEIPRLSLTRRLVKMDGGELLLGLILTFAIQSAIVAFIFFEWIRAGFSGLELSSILMLSAHFLGALGVLSLGLLGVKVLNQIG